MLEFYTKMKATLIHLEKVLKASFQDAKRLKSLTKTFESGWSLNLDFILKLLFPCYYEYQEELEKQMKSLEKEVMNYEK